MGQPATLGGLRVVEIAGRPSMRFAGMVLAELGADVTRIELPGRGANAHPLASEMALKLVWDHRKRCVGAEDLATAMDGADVLLTSAPHGADDAFARSIDGAEFDGIHVLATPFGTTGPYRSYVADDLNLAAFGGAAVFVGEGNREPLVPPFMMAAEQSGLTAVVAVLAALRAEPGPCQVDIAEFEVLATNHMTGLYSLSFHLGPVHRRAGHRKPNPYPFTILPCRDGQVCVAFLGGHQWRRLLSVMGDPEWALDERFSDRRQMGALYADELDELVCTWLRDRSRDELRDIAVRTRLPLGPLQRIGDLLTDRQLAHRGFWDKSAVHPSCNLVLPRLPFQDTSVTLDRTPDGPSHARPAAAGAAPLSGVRVLDLSWVMSGPMSSQMLADLGADVVKVESVTHLDSSREGLALAPTDPEAATDDGPNMMPYFNNVNRGKRSLVLNLSTAAGREALFKLAETADVIVENIGAGALERLGITCEQLHQCNPASVIVRISMAGQDGPDAALPGYAPQSTAVGGLDALCGYPGETPCGMIALNYGDVSVALFGAVATLSALRRAEHGGQGTVIDLSMIEAHVNALGPVLAAHQLGEIADAPVGNDHREYYPHGMYRCRGDDDWISISVTSSAEWEALCSLTGAPDALRRLAGADERRRADAQITEHLRAWSAKIDSASAFHDLQGVGVHAAPTMGAEELLIDEHVAARDDVVGIEHHLLGYLPIYGSPLKSHPPLVQIAGRAPDLGEHSLAVLREAGVSEETITDWTHGGAFDGLDIGAAQGDPAELTSRDGPLRGIRVIDLGHWAAGPIAGMVLGDLGAEVIKVEPPNGDPARAMGVNFPGGWSTFFLAVNRNKHFVSIDYRTDAGRELLKNLIAQSDVLIENSRPGTWQRYGLDYESLKQVNPRLIYVSLSGFGAHGPMRDWLAMDPIAQAAGGLVGITGSDAGGHAKVGAAVTDTTSGRLAAFGAVTALFDRERTGRGQLVETDLFSTAVSMLTMRETEFQFSQQNPPLMGTAHGQIVPAEAFETADGRWVMLCVYGEEHFAKLARLCDAEYLLEDLRFASNSARHQNRGAVSDEIARIIKGKPEHEWTARLAGQIPYGPVLEFDQLWSHPQLEASGLIMPFEVPGLGEVRTVGSPVRFSRFRPSVRTVPGELGRDTTAVLTDLGYSDDEIKQLTDAGTVSVAGAPTGGRDRPNPSDA